MSLAATRVAIAECDELAHGVPSVADHMCRDALGARDDAAAYDQHAMVASFVEALDHDA